MEKILVNLAERSYNIIFNNSFDNLVNALKEVNIKGKILIITDTNVEEYYLNSVCDALNCNDFLVYTFSFVAGEKSKNQNTLFEIYKKCIEINLDRKSTIIALGGGVVGDIAGYAASTYLRGINFVQIPTTLLAQVDSSVGGKVAIDFEGHKNMIGSFYQPKLVYINYETLKTLPSREFYAGMAEVIKYGIIKDYNFFEYLENNYLKILNKNPQEIIYILKKCCEIKADVVMADEKENDLRAILNFGHTMGHAIETACNFTHLHGECIAIGMVGASFLSKLCGFYNGDVEKIEKLIKSCNLPVSIKNIDIENVKKIMQKDKKQQANKVKFVLMSKIGEVFQTNELDDKKIDLALKYIIE